MNLSRASRAHFFVVFLILSAAFNESFFCDTSSCLCLAREATSTKSTLKCFKIYRRSHKGTEMLLQLAHEITCFSRHNPPRSTLKQKICFVQIFAAKFWARGERKKNFWARDCCLIDCRASTDDRRRATQHLRDSFLSGSLTDGHQKRLRSICITIGDESFFLLSAISSELEFTGHKTLAHGSSDDFAFSAPLQAICLCLQNTSRVIHWAGCERPRWISDRGGLTRSKDTALTASSLRAFLRERKSNLNIWSVAIAFDWAYNESQLCVVSCSAWSSWARKRSANKRAELRLSDAAYRTRWVTGPKVGSDFCHSTRYLWAQLLNYRYFWLGSYVCWVCCLPQSSRNVAIDFFFLLVRGDDDAGIFLAQPEAELQTRGMLGVKKVRRGQSWKLKNFNPRFRKGGWSLNRF